MKFQLEIELDGDRMADGFDVAHALRKLADYLSGNIAATTLDVQHQGDILIRDGVTCGSWNVTRPQYKPGDRCRNFNEDGEPRVEHYDCDEHPDFTVTNPMTGKIIRESSN